MAAFVSGAVQRFGKLYGLVNSAGIRGVGNVLDVDPETWRRVLSVNLDGTFNVCQAFARVVTGARTPAAIVNLSSAAGIRGVPNRLPYAASKYGIVGITQTMALELGPFGVRVNAVVRPFRCSVVAPPTASASMPIYTPADLPASMADGGSGHANTPNSRPPGAAGVSHWCDQAMRLNRRGRHCFSRSHKGEGKADESNQLDHSLLPF